MKEEEERADTALGPQKESDVEESKVGPANDATVWHANARERFLFYVMGAYPSTVLLRVGYVILQKLQDYLPS